MKLLHLQISIPIYVRIHVSGLLISLWQPANSLFVRAKYVTPTGKRLNACYLQKKARKNIPFDITANNTCVWFIGDLLHTEDNYFDTTVYIQQ